MLHHGNIVYLSGGSQAQDRNRGEIFVFILENGAIPEGPSFLDDPRPEGAITVYAGHGDYVCFTAAAHPVTAEVLNLGESTFGSLAEATAVCPTPSPSGPPTPQY